MTVIYIDILIGINIYITYILLLSTEIFIKSKANILKRGISSSVGGVFSLIIFLPELSFFILTILKLLMAMTIILINFGFEKFSIFIKRIVCFFSINFIFAGLMILIWFSFTPPKLVIRNGIVYYHLSAIILIISTIIAYSFIKLINFFLSRLIPKTLIFDAEITVNQKQTALKLFLDTGNKAFSINGLPAVFCNTNVLSEIIPIEALNDMKNLISPKIQKYALKTQIVPYDTIADKGVFLGFKPDLFIVIKDNEKQSVNCVIVPIFKPLANREVDAIAGESLFKK